MKYVLYSIIYISILSGFNGLFCMKEYEKKDIENSADSSEEVDRKNFKDIFMRCFMSENANNSSQEIIAMTDFIMSSYMIEDMHIKSNVINNLEQLYTMEPKKYHLLKKIMKHSLTASANTTKKEKFKKLRVKADLAAGELINNSFLHYIENQDKEIKYYNNMSYKAIGFISFEVCCAALAVVGILVPGIIGCTE